MRGWRWTGVLFVALALSGAGCAGDERGGGGAGGSGGGAEAVQAAEAETSAAPPGDPADRREIVYTADARVRVDDVEDAARQATALAEDADGFLAGQASELVGDPSSTITLRVPSARFRAVLDAVTGLGDVRQRSIDSSDVTAEVVDLEGRIESLEASAARLRSLIAEAGDTAAIVTVEQELARREADLESLEGRRRVLDDQATFATITVRFTEDAGDPAGDDDLPGFVSALEAGGAALLTALRLLLVVVGFLLPFVPFALAAWFGIRWWRRRHPAAEREPVAWPTASPGGITPFGQRGPAPAHRPPPPAAPGASPGASSGPAATAVVDRAATVAGDGGAESDDGPDGDAAGGIGGVAPSDGGGGDETSR